MQVHNSLDCSGTYNRLHQFKLIKSTIFVYITKSSIFVECKAAQDIQHSVSLGH